MQGVLVCSTHNNRACRQHLCLMSTTAVGSLSMCGAGLEDIDFWDSMGGIGVPEDPLMQAVEAAMGCTDESEISCFDATTPGF